MHNGRRDRTCIRCARSCVMHVQTDIYIYIYIYIYRISNRTRLLASLRSAARQLFNQLQFSPISFTSVPSLIHNSAATLLLPYVAKCSRSIIFANFANGTHSRILLFANLYVRTYTVYSYICVRTIITTWCHIKMADVDGSSLLVKALLWTKFNGIR